MSIIKQLKNIFIILILPVFFLSCKDDSEIDKVNKVIEDFYIYFNQKDLDKIKEISTHKLDMYFEFVFSIGDNLVQIDSIEIIDTKIEATKAVVNVKTIDIYDNVMIYNWHLIKVNDKWKINELNGHKDEKVLNKEDIEYSKKDNPPKDTNVNLKQTK